jgi:hypothetical protein
LEGQESFGHEGLRSVMSCGTAAGSSVESERMARRGGHAERGRADETRAQKAMVQRAVGRRNSMTRQATDQSVRKPRPSGQSAQRLNISSGDHIPGS